MAISDGLEPSTHSLEGCCSILLSYETNWCIYIIVSRDTGISTDSMSYKEITAMHIYSGYIYLWYDTRAKLFYLGGHKGKVEDSYICSNKMMLRAYKKRPETFKFKVLEYVYESTQLRKTEQKWLDKIKDEELYWTPNIYNKTVKYYNQKKHSSGGNGSANKGKSTIGGWNRSLTGVQTYSEERNKKISLSCVGRKRLYKQDGTWTWFYPS
jgi:hypothetical protein